MSSRRRAIMDSYLTPSRGVTRGGTQRRRRAPRGITDPSDISRGFGPVHPSDRSRMENFGRVRPDPFVIDRADVRGSNPNPGSKERGAPGGVGGVMPSGIAHALSDPRVRYELLRRRRGGMRSGNRGKAMGL